MLEQVGRASARKRDLDKRIKMPSVASLGSRLLLLFTPVGLRFCVSLGVPVTYQSHTSHIPVTFQSQSQSQTQSQTPTLGVLHMFITIKS